MSRALLLSVHFHDGRFHGVPDWPPCPARVFQALVAAAARGASLTTNDHTALQWLENLDPPTIGSPGARTGATVTNYVPNNDLDSVGHNPRRTGEIRAAKLIRPMIFDSAVPLLYLWHFRPSAESETNAAKVCAVAEQLYQLGRGVDMAWAFGEVLDAAQGEERLSAHKGPIHRPAPSGRGFSLAAPSLGSLASLIERHKRNGTRFSEIREAAPTVNDPHKTRPAGTAFAQPPKPRFRQVAYDCPNTLLLFDLTGQKSPWPQSRIVELVEAIRDGAAERLKFAYEQAGHPNAAKIEPVFIGRNATNADKAARIRIIPLPSIGSQHVTRAIRRVLVEVPPNCPITAEDIAWAFSGAGAETTDPETGEVIDIWRLTPADDDKMLSHYGVKPASTSTTWRSVTPIALPATARRRRIDPERVREEIKGGSERLQEEASASSAVRAALRHEGMTTPVYRIGVQREPFASQGARAEKFATKRFQKEQLWHAEVVFTEPVQGPLALGDGRYLGLGMMAPHQEPSSFIAFKITGGLLQTDNPDHVAITRAFRRAVIARVADGSKHPLPTFFSGHDADGDVARSGRHDHLAFVLDPVRLRLLLIAPHILAHRRANASDRREFDRLIRAMSGFFMLRAGGAGLLTLDRMAVDPATDPLFTASRKWRSATPFVAIKHGKRTTANALIAENLATEIARLGLPAAKVSVHNARGIAGVGVTGDAVLEFNVAVSGPILIGRNRHFGGGLFVGSGPA